MIFITFNQETKRVENIHYKPFDEKYGLGKTQEELVKEGILVEFIPEPIQQEGKEAILYVNITTKELYYQYVDLPKSEEPQEPGYQKTLSEQILELKTNQALINQVVENNSAQQQELLELLIDMGVI